MSHFTHFSDFRDLELGVSSRKMNERLREMSEISKGRSMKLAEQLCKVVAWGLGLAGATSILFQIVERQLSSRAGEIRVDEQGDLFPGNESSCFLELQMSATTNAFTLKLKPFWKSDNSPLFFTFPLVALLAYGIIWWYNYSQYYITRVQKTPVAANIFGTTSPNIRSPTRKTFGSL